MNCGDLVKLMREDGVEGDLISSALNGLERSLKCL